MSFRDYINETTKFAKAMQYLHGQKDFGEGLAIFTSMNPDTKTATAEKNKKLYKDLLSTLKRKGKKYIKQLGKYNVDEKSVIAIDITLRETLDISKKPEWKQGTIIWFSKDNGDKIKSAMIGNGKVVKTKSIHSGKAAQELENFYSIIGNRKYSMAFEGTFYKLSNGEVLSEEYLKRIKSTVPGKGKIELFKNPTPRDHKDLGNYIRFTVDNKKKVVYAWRYDEAHHKDISKAVGIRHSFNDPDLLTGVAEWQGQYVFHSADFLKDFKKMVGADREYLKKLAYNDWEWVNRYIKVDKVIKVIRDYVK